MHLVFIYFNTKEECILSLFIYNRLPWRVCRLKIGQTHFEYLALSVFQLETPVYAVYNKASKLGIYGLLCTGNDRKNAAALLRCAYVFQLVYVSCAVDLSLARNLGMCTGSPRATNIRANKQRHNKHYWLTVAPLESQLIFMTQSSQRWMLNFPYKHFKENASKKPITQSIVYPYYGSQLYLLFNSYMFRPQWQSSGRLL